MTPAHPTPPLRVPIEVLIVEDHQMVAEMIASTIACESDLAVVGCAGTIADALTMIDQGPVDVVLMDYRLPDGDGIGAARAIRARHPATRVVMVTGEENDHILADALRAGCAGYVCKSESVATLATAVRGAHAGSTAVSPEMLTQMITSADRDHDRAACDELTERELDVLRLLAEGVSSAGVATRLFISPNTVRNHTQSVLEKLGAHSRLEAVTVAIRSGLVIAPH